MNLGAAGKMPATELPSVTQAVMFERDTVTGAAP